MQRIMTIQVKILVFLASIILCLLASHFDSSVLKKSYADIDQTAVTLID